MLLIELLGTVAPLIQKAINNVTKIIIRQKHVKHFRLIKLNQLNSAHVSAAYKEPRAEM